MDEISLIQNINMKRDALRKTDNLYDKILQGSDFYLLPNSRYKEFREIHTIKYTYLATYLILLGVFNIDSLSDQLSAELYKIEKEKFEKFKSKIPEKSTIYLCINLPLNLRIKSVNNFNIDCEETISFCALYRKPRLTYMEYMKGIVK